MVVDPIAALFGVLICVAVAYFCFRWIIRNSQGIGLEGFGLIYLVFGFIALGGAFVLALTIFQHFSPDAP